MIENPVVGHRLDLAPEKSVGIGMAKNIPGTMVVMAGGVMLSIQLTPEGLRCMGAMLIDEANNMQRDEGPGQIVELRPALPLKTAAL